MAAPKRPKAPSRTPKPSQQTTKQTSRSARARPKTTAAPTEVPVETALQWLAEHATPHDHDNMARFGISTSDKVLGVSMANIQKVGKRLGKSHTLAEALWASGCYEARMLCSFVDEPALVSAAQLERWCRDFDNWAVCDTLCFYLFDRTPHAWAKVKLWSTRRDEFQKRAAFALLASLAGHDKTSGDAPFLAGLKLVEQAADDERNFVKKAVLWALRRIGGRSRKLHESALALCARLIATDATSARSIGKEALRELQKPGVLKRLAKG